MVKKVLPGWGYMRQREIPQELPEPDNLEQITSPVLDLHKVCIMLNIRLILHG